MASVRRARAIGVAVFAVAGLASAAQAQSASEPAPGATSAAPASAPGGVPAVAPVAAPIGDPMSGVRLVPVDPGTEDVSNLWSGGRQMPVDLRTPLDFDQVYRVEGDLSRLGVLGVGSRPDQVMYARASGGTIAIFPRSKYVPTREGMFPVIPENTTFVTSSLSVPAINTSWMKQDSGTITAASAAQKVYLRANVAGAQQELEAKAPRREPATIWTSEVVRRSRLAALMDQARGAEAEPSQEHAERAPAAAVPAGTGSAPSSEHAQAPEPGAVSETPVTPASSP